MRLLLVDDHKIVRDGLKQILLSFYPTAIITESGDAEDAIHQLSRSEFDVVICDLNLPGRSGLDVVKQVKESHPNLPVLILSMNPEKQYALRALKAGASGYLNKAKGAEEIMAAIERVRLGRRYISPEVSDLLVDDISSVSALPHEDLSDRELHVFKMLAEGKSISGIAESLSIALSTVSTHRSRILEKMAMKTNADLTKYAIEHNLL
jgi:DNA-binding NarL/FixJ family response regulator